MQPFSKACLSVHVLFSVVQITFSRDEMHSLARPREDGAVSEASPPPPVLPARPPRQ